MGGYQVVDPLGKVLGWLYLLGKWVRLFNPFASKASGFGGVADSFPSSLVPSIFDSLRIFLSSNVNTYYIIIDYY